MHRSSRSRHTLMGALVALVAAAVGAPAVAHTPLVRTSPARGATVTHLPTTVKLTFGRSLKGVASVRVVRAATGRNHTVRARLNSTNKAQVLVTTASDRVGRYTVYWRVVVADGHTLSGSYGFRVAR